MSCKAAVYTVNSSAATYTPSANGTVIPFGETMRRFGNSGCRPTIACDGTKISIADNGYYDFDVSATIATPTAGLVTFQLYMNGTPIDGATASSQTDANTQVVNVSFPSLLRKTCCAEGSNVTLVATGVPFVLYNLSTVAKKV